MNAIRLALCALACACPLVGQAQSETRAMVLEESASIMPPTSSWRYFGRFGVAIDGDYALVLAERFVVDPNSELGTRREGTAFLYLRSGSDWQHIGRLGSIETITEWVRPGLAMKDGVAMVILHSAHIYERIGTQWRRTQVSYGAGDPNAIQGDDIEIDNGRILVSRLGGDHTSFVYGKVGTTWQIQGVLSGHSNEGGDNPPSSSQDLLGERAMVFNEAGINFEPPLARMFRPNESGTGWRELAVFENPGLDTHFGPGIAKTSRYIAVTGSRERGTAILYESNLTWHWSRDGLRAADSYLQDDLASATALERAGPHFAQRNYSFNRQAHVINLFRVNSNFMQNNTHVATLQARNGQSLGALLDATRPDENGRMRVIVSGRVGSGGDNTVRIFEVPDVEVQSTLTPLPVTVVDFDNPGAPQWNFINPVQLRVVNEGQTNVWRQRDSTADGGAWLADRSSRNQSIQSEITILRTNGADRWAGLMTRYDGEDNFYFVTLRTSSTVQLKRMLNGEITTLASVPVSVMRGTKYRLRLESIGTAHRVYLDERLMATAYDSTLAEGSPGIRVFRATADFDNVIVTPSPFTTIYQQDFATAQPGSWNDVLGEWLSTGGTYRQSSTSGDARAMIGAATDDQVVQVRVRPLSFEASNRWVGVVARYDDPDNLMYVTLRANNILSLRRYIDDVLVVLTEKPYPVNIGTWYTVRIEVVKGWTRVYVNNRLELATTADPGPPTVDPILQKGQVGLWMYKATAEYDDFLAYQP